MSDIYQMLLIPYKNIVFMTGNKSKYPQITVGAEDDEHCSVLHPTPRDFSESRARPTRSRDLSTEQTGLFADPDRTPAPLDSVEDVERDEHGDQTDGFSYNMSMKVFSACLVLTF